MVAPGDVKLTSRELDHGSRIARGTLNMTTISPP